MNNDIKTVVWFAIIGGILMLLLTGCEEEKQNDFEPIGVFESSIQATTPAITDDNYTEDGRKIPTLKEEYR